MNRVTLSAIVRHSQRSAQARQNTANHLPKEQCIVWLPERGGYLKSIEFRAANGRTESAVRTCEAPTQAAIYSGDRATTIAEQLIRNHGLKPVLRPHYGRVN